MTTSELICALRKADPIGSIQVCVDNHAVFAVQYVEAYHDGPLEVLIRDKNKPGYDVVGARIVGSGGKIDIETLSIEDAIAGNPNLPVELIHLGDVTSDRMQETIESWRDEVRKAMAEADEAT